MVQVLGNQRSFNVALLKFCCRLSRRACRKRGESSNFWSATPWGVAPLTRIATNSASEASSSIWIFSGPQASPNDEKTHQAPLLRGTFLDRCRRPSRLLVVQMKAQRSQIAIPNSLDRRVVLTVTLVCKSA
jgi:hypothetical protein